MQILFCYTAGVISEDHPYTTKEITARKLNNNDQTPKAAGGFLFGPGVSTTPGMPTSTVPTNIPTDTTMIQGKILRNYKKYYQFIALSISSLVIDKSFGRY